jgi:O-acetyl-ADP-ribose deacetylase (regulator of RNase III)
MITYVKGDATSPQGDGNRIIAHVCNDQGGWGAGFVLALSARDKTPEEMYREWPDGRYSAVPFALGKVQVCPFTDDPGLYVANMIAQRGYSKPGHPALSYAYLTTCLIKLQKIAAAMRPQATVHMPRIGCGLAGGDWNKVSLLIEHFLVDYGVPVMVYDLPVFGMVDAGGLEEQRIAREHRHVENEGHPGDPSEYGDSN